MLLLEPLVLRQKTVYTKRNADERTIKQQLKLTKYKKKI